MASEFVVEPVLKELRKCATCAENDVKIDVQI